MAARMQGAAHGPAGMPQMRHPAAKRSPLQAPWRTINSLGAAWPRRIDRRHARAEKEATQKCSKRAGCHLEQHGRQRAAQRRGCHGGALQDGQVEASNGQNVASGHLLPSGERVRQQHWVRSRAEATEASVSPNSIQQWPGCCQRAPPAASHEWRKLAPALKRQEHARVVAYSHTKPSTSRA